MGTFVPCPNVAEVAMHYNLSGEHCENVFHILGTGAWTVSSLTALMTAMNGWEIDDMSALRTNTCQFQRITAVDLTTQDGLALEMDADPITDGAEPTPMPNNVTLAIKHVTNHRGRSFRGRTFFVGIAEVSVTGNTVTPAFSAALLSRMGGIFAAVATANGGKLVVLSRRHNGADRTTGVSTEVVQFTLNPVIDSQRRRLPEHNRHH